MDTLPASDEKLASLKTLTTVIYALYALSLLGFGTPAVVAIVLDYLKREDARGTWLESHFRWQIRTFWWSLLWCIVGWIAWILLLGWLVWGVAAVWFIYRIAKGWLTLNDNQPMPIQ